MLHVHHRRQFVLFIATALLAALLIVVSADRGAATEETLPSADEIVLELESGNNRLVYGVSEQLFAPSPSSCNIASSGDTIMTISTTATNKQGDEVDGKLGLADDGLGSNLKGNGNGQDCGRVGTDESLTLQLHSAVGSKAIESVDWHFEGKFDARVRVEYHQPGGGSFIEDYDLNDQGSDSGPDSKLGDDYRVNDAPRLSANDGKLFTAVTITAIQGEVSLKGGDWPDGEVDRTVFHLLDAVACGDATTDGGPEFADDPLAAFWLGASTKGTTPCLVPIEITTENTTDLENGTQVVNVAPPSSVPDAWDGFGLTGVLTIEWDVEPPDDSPIDRTEVLVNSTTGATEVIRWCNEEVPIMLADGSWYYELATASGVYSNATLYDDGRKDICLIEQYTETVEFNVGTDESPVYEIRTRTTEVFYLWNDPQLIRPR